MFDRLRGLTANETAAHAEGPAMAAALDDEEFITEPPYRITDLPFGSLRAVMLGESLDPVTQATIEVANTMGSAKQNMEGDSVA